MELAGHRRAFLRQAAGAIGGMLASPAWALATSPTRIFVSATGNDGNSGTFSSPMRTFQGAHNAVASGGEIVALDSAGYGAVTINHDVTITVPPGVDAFVAVSVGEGVIINSGLNVILRGLVIEAVGTGVGAGIFATAPKFLLIEGCKIAGFGQTGPSSSDSGGLVIDTSATTPGATTVSDTVISNCPGCGIAYGNVGQPTNSILVVERCRLLSNGTGLFAGERGRVTVRNSVISQNTITGIQGGGFGTSDVQINVENCAVTDNGVGINSQFSENVTVSNTSITGNTTGVTGAPLTYGNNQLTNNTTNGSMGTLVVSK
jgi:hypothetical protein